MTAGTPEGRDPEARVAAAERERDEWKSEADVQTRNKEYWFEQSEKFEAEAATLRAHLAEREGGRTPEAGVTADQRAKWKLLRGPHWSYGRQSEGDGRVWSVWAGGASDARVAHGLFQHEAATIAKHVNTLREVIDDILTALSASSTSLDPECPTCAEREGQLVAAQEALREIAKGEGAFSRDPLTHASNTIESMKAIATAALAAPPRAPQPPTEETK